MTTLDVSGFGVYGRRGGVSALRGRWSLSGAGRVELHARRRLPWPGRARELPLVSGALTVGDPAHLTVGEVCVAVDKTRAVRLTVAEVTALGNRRYAVDLIVSALGPDGGPDEAARLEGGVSKGRDGVLRAAFAGPAPSAFGLAGARMRLCAAFLR